MNKIEDLQVSPKKKWWKSRTLWFNALVAALGALEMSANLIQPFLPSNVYGYGFCVLTVGNAVLRIVTTQGLSIK